VQHANASVRTCALMGPVPANPCALCRRSWRAYRRGEGDLILKHTMSDAFATLKEKGVRSAEIRTALMNQRVELVLTAHPTQAVRRTMLHKLTAYALSRRKPLRVYRTGHLPGCTLAHAVRTVQAGRAAGGARPDEPDADRDGRHSPAHED